jgi:NADPH:quinone reductase-like Zn-dependent oxidoreductase
MLVRMLSLPPRRLSREDVAMRTCPPVRAIVFAGTGGRAVMRLEQRPDPVPGSEELLVATTFAGVNTADLAQCAGAYPAPPGAPQDVPGLEVAGAVVARGSTVRDFAEGDRVFGLVGGGGLADRVLAHERHVASVPDRLGDEEAAAVPEAFITAHDAVGTQAQVGLGEVRLVNGANGGVGTAVQIGVAAGACVFPCARSRHQGLVELGAQAVNPGDALDQVGTAGDADLSLRKLMGKRARLADGRVRAIVDRVFPAEEAADAFDHMAGSGKFGKVLLAF